MSAAPVRFRLATPAERAAIFGIAHPPITPVPVAAPQIANLPAANAPAPPRRRTKEVTTTR